MSTRTWLGISALALLVGCAPAGTRQQAASTTVVSTERVQRIDRLLDTAVEDGRNAGLVALVLRDGEVIYERAVGWADKEAGRQMETTTMFRIASQTKAITSAVILSLVEEGALGLSDPVSRFIESFGGSTVLTADMKAPVPVRRGITIRDLLTHTSGLSYGTDAHLAALYEAKGLGRAAGNGWYTADKDEPICDTMERLGTLPLAAQPGERYVYGYSTDVLGCVIERVTGSPLDEVFRTRIFEPLGMSDSHFFLPAEKRDRLATVYMTGTDDLAVRAPDGSRGQGHYVDGPRRNFAGGAGLVSTARDYARFLEMIRRGGELDGARVLSPRTIRLMRTNQIGTLFQPDGGMGFGFGFSVTQRDGANGLDAPGAYGWGGAYSTLYRIDPESGLVLLLMQQLMPDRTGIQTRYAVSVYQAFALE